MPDLSLSSHFTSLADNLIDLLELAGDNIADLDLYAVDQIDVKAIAMISIYCKQLGDTLFSLLVLCMMGVWWQVQGFFLCFTRNAQGTMFQTVPKEGSS